MSSEQEQQAAAALAQEKESKKLLAKKTIEAKCKEGSSNFKDIQAIGDALNKGDSLELKVLSGGETNFSYKVYLKNDPTKTLFAKLSFQKALWNPDPTVHYDLARVDSEYKIMNQFADMLGGHGTAPVAQPFYVIDLDPADNDGADAKLFIAEWNTKADEQFANQFSDGNVDPRVITGLAKALATLNLTPVEPEWNEDCRTCFRSLHPAFKGIFGQFTELPDDQSDAAVKRCKELGLPSLEAMIDKMDVEYMEFRQVLNHNDTKQFNILVEPTTDDGSFGKTGSFAVCDWEMSVKGKSGKDIGVFWAYSLACALCHAAHGNEKEARHLLQTSMDFWNQYADNLLEKGNKDEAYLIDTLRGAFGGAFLYLFFAYYAFGMHTDVMPFDGLTPELAAKAKGAMGLVGVFLGEESYGEHISSDLSLEELKALFANKVTSEINALLVESSGTEPPATLAQKRRSSTLNKHHHRESNRRASDAMMMEEAIKRMSVHFAGGDKRASIYGLQIPDAATLLELDDE